MFKEMRRKNRSTDNQQAIQLLKEGQYGVLSTVGENGYPYGVPLNHIYYKGSLYFHCATEGSKLDNIVHNNKVSYCVVGNTEPDPEKFSYRFESVIVFGRAVEVDNEEKEDVLAALTEKYFGESEKGLEYIQRNGNKAKVFKINIEHLTGKARK